MIHSREDELKLLLGDKRVDYFIYDFIESVHVDYGKLSRVLKEKYKEDLPKKLSPVFVEIVDINKDPWEKFLLTKGV